MFVLQLLYVMTFLVYFFFKFFYLTFVESGEVLLRLQRFLQFVDLNRVYTNTCKMKKKKKKKKKKKSAKLATH